MGTKKENTIQFNKGVLYILITAVAFSTMEIASKTISAQVNPFQMTMIRFSMGGLLLLPFAIAELRKRKFSLKLNDFLFFALTGIIGIVISMSFFQSAVLYTKASIVAVIFSTNPIFTLPLARLILKEKLSLVKLISFGVSILGVLMIFNPFGVTGDLKGIVLAFVASVSFSLYGVISKKRLVQYGGLVLNCFSFLIGGMVLCAGMLIFHIPVTSGINLQTLPMLLYLSFFVTGIGYICYFAAMKHTSAVTASSVFFIKPALAPILAFLILRERLSMNMIIGIIFILIAAGVLFWENNRIAAAAKVETGKE